MIISEQTPTKGEKGGSMRNQEHDSSICHQFLFKNDRIINRMPIFNIQKM
jgi:hypothetical protein